MTEEEWNSQFIVCKIAQKLYKQDQGRFAGNVKENICYNNCAMSVGGLNVDKRHRDACRIYTALPWDYQKELERQSKEQLGISQ